MTFSASSQIAPSITPLLIRHLVKRRGQDTLPGGYSASTHVWMVEGENGLEPLVQSDGTLLELLTKTKADNREQDDDSLMAAITKTMAQIESDDDQSQFYTSGLLELVTKTDSISERDD